MLKLIICCVFFIVLKPHVAHAQLDSTLNTSKVYIFRATGNSSSLVNMRVVINGEITCKISNNHYAVLNIIPGIYTFHATTWDSPSLKPDLGLELNIEPGKQYYLKMILKEKIFSSQLFFAEITYNSAKRLLEKCKEDINCD